MVTSTPGAGPATRPTPSPGERAWTLMLELVEAHSRHGALAEAVGFRLGGGRGKVLFQLRNGPLTLSQLAATHGLDASYATLIVDKLEVLGMVERGPHPDDRRRKLVTLTAAGHAAIAAADAIRARPPRAMGVLGEDEARALAGLCQRLVDADGIDHAGSGAV